jgi:hypothetical protein
VAEPSGQVSRDSISALRVVVQHEHFDVRGALLGRAALVKRRNHSRIADELGLSAYGA